MRQHIRDIVQRVIADQRHGRHRARPSTRRRGPAVGSASEFYVDGSLFGLAGPGVRRSAYGDPGKRRHAQPVRFAAQADVHAESGVSRVSAQVGHQASTRTVACGHQRHQPGRLRGVFQVHRRGGSIFTQSHGVRRGEQVRPRIRVAAPRRPGANTCKR